MKKQDDKLEKNSEFIIEKIRNIFICIVVFMVLILGILVSLYQFRYYSSGEKILLSNYETLTNEESLYDIQYIKEKNSKYYTIEGFALYKGAEMVEFESKLVLYHEGEDVAISLPLEMKNNENINNIVADGIDYKNTAFIANINKDLVDNNNYLIGFLIKVGDDIKLIKTDEKFGLKDNKE